jgi:hypothetical protein
MTNRPAIIDRTSRPERADDFLSLSIDGELELAEFDSSFYSLPSNNGITLEQVVPAR